MYNTHMSCI